MHSTPHSDARHLQQPLEPALGGCVVIYGDVKERHRGPAVELLRLRSIQAVTVQGPQAQHRPPTGQQPWAGDGGQSCPLQGGGECMEGLHSLTKDDL